MRSILKPIVTLLALAFSRRPKVIPYVPQYRPLLPKQREIQRAWSLGALRSAGIRQ